MKGANPSSHSLQKERHKRIALFKRAIRAKLADHSSHFYERVTRSFLEWALLCLKRKLKTGLFGFAFIKKTKESKQLFLKEWRESDSLLLLFLKE